MKPPARLKVGHLTYRVALVAGMPDDIYADVDHDTLEIRVRPDLAPGQTAEKLLHEILHGCYDSWKIGPRWGEERTVTALAPALCAVLRDNPALVKWLQAALGEDDAA